MNKKLFFLFFIGFLISWISTNIQADTIRGESFAVAIMRSPEHLFHEPIVENLKEKIEQALPKTVKVTFISASASEIIQLVKENRVNLIFSNSVLFRSLIPYGVRDIATIQSEWTPNPNRADGAVVVVKRNSPFNSLEDLKGRTMALEKGREFDALYFLLGEIKEKSKQRNPEDFFKLQNSDAGSKGLIKQVVNGGSDAAVLPACFLESFAVEDPTILKKIKVLNPLRSPELPCTVSSSLYPNWTLSMTSNISMKEATDIARALLSTKRGESGIWWVVSTQFTNVDQLLKKLKVQQYSYLRERSLREFINEYLWAILLGGTVVFGTVLYAFFANRLVKARTLQLSQALRRQSQYKTQYELVRKNNEIFKRMGVVTQISSVISHELTQPLNAISCYTNGLLVLLDNKELPREQVQSVLYKISKSNSYANQIIQRIKNFSRFGRKPTQIEINATIEEAVDGYLLSSHSAEKIDLHKSAPVYVYADPFEIEIMILNLLRNASDATKNVANACIKVSVEIEDTGIVTIVISDNGAKYEQSFVDTFSKGFETHKKGGMGIGLSIVGEVVSNMDGKVRFVANKDGGVSVIISLPRIDYEE